MINLIKSECEDKMKKSILALEEDFTNIRTGRASTGLVDKISVSYFGTPTPLNQVATISIPEARMIVIQPWDKSVLGEIEKSILKSDLGLTPNNDGKIIRLNIPALTEERRKDLVKVAKTKAENSKVSIRNIRRDAIDKIKKSQKNNEITEDEMKKGETEIQTITDKFIQEVSNVLEVKEKEIMEV